MLGPDRSIGIATETTDTSIETLQISEIPDASALKNKHPWDLFRELYLLNIYLDRLLALEVSPIFYESLEYAAQPLIFGLRVPTLSVLFDSLFH